ncbi:hypothetical protein [Rhodococcus sp. LW-XY12]|uniref:hypothetical protein n=1 Tax=Rhodococcus sp. LW-XY12 TaxID=2856851 RepID=UPI001C58CBBE|nr:hypothetical protein [Rhodococcus sp. LW-XY12]QXU51844.1 hypothetical protein KXC42_12970 [Rhodococcus sp. LW-XY12]QXU53032.1 hypothetical protein KXC42_19855 [Rhodococcus sp. LW-XY12]QXU53484.1 hypothetical protein KXC42_22535 [Rhodococcus sp. LW-XY12]
MRSQDAGEFTEDLIVRTWRKRRAAERTPLGVEVGFGLASAGLLGVVVNPDEIPGSVPMAAGVAVAMFGILGLLALIQLRRSGSRGHTGNLDVSPWGGSATPWWRSPTMLTPVLFAAVFLGRPLGVFDQPAGIIVVAVLLGISTAWMIRASGMQDPIYGRDPDQPPVLGSDARSAVGRGELAPDVLELIALQAHTSERRISWCARVLDTSEAGIRERIARGRRWLEYPATDVHDPSTARWVRLTEAGREVLIRP